LAAEQTRTPISARLITGAGEFDKGSPSVAPVPRAATLARRRIGPITTARRPHRHSDRGGEDKRDREAQHQGPRPDRARVLHSGTRGVVAVGDVVPTGTRAAGAGDQHGHHGTRKWGWLCAGGLGFTAVAVLAVLLAVAPTHTTPSAAPAPAPAPMSQLMIWLTGYSWQDNTPAGSSIVGEPVLHHRAGGQGTYADPITVAVPGHAGAMAWRPGTRFYLPTVARYVIVEDSGAARAPVGTETHLDMWIGGQGGTKAATDDCESQFTGRVPALPNPPPTLPVTTGPIFAQNRCNIPAQPHNMGTYTAPSE
jgi:hypothetical protein